MTDEAVIKFTEHEIKAMAESPEILRELSEYHEFQITMADSMGFGYSYHEKRKDELSAEADRIEAEY